MMMGISSAPKDDLGALGGRLSDLYRAHAPSATRLAYLLTGDQASAEDLVQDAFIRVAGRLAHLRNPEAFESYLRKTIVNLNRMRFRRHRVEHRYLDRHKEIPTAVAGELDEVETLRQSLQRLPHRQRAALVLRFYVDLPDHETADILGCSPSTVRSLVARGLSALRQEMTDD
jgi:RNA polymerase sigma-70 factor (sigma-E family)